jgi:hypothetical protein
LPAPGDADMEEVGVPQHGRRRGEAAAGVAVDADAGEVDPRVAFGELPHDRDLVRQPVVRRSP